MNRRTIALPWLVAIALVMPGCDLFRSADERVARAEQQIAAQDYRGAMIELKNALQDEPNNFRAWTRLAEVEFRLGDVVGAEKDLRRAFELGKPEPQDAELMARIQLALGRGRQLLEQIDTQQLQLPGSAIPYYRGHALLISQQFEAAQAAFESIDASDARASAAQVGAAEALAGQGKSDQALARLDAMIVAKPTLVEALLSRGAIRARRGEFAAAEEDLQRGRELGGASLSVVQSLNLLAVLTETQLARGDTKAASATYSELAKIAPDGVAMRVLSARIAMAKQDYSAAIADLQRALAGSPDAVAARFLLGAAFFAQGNPRQAEQHLTQVLQRAPENLEARKLLAQIHLINGRPDAAMQVLLPAQQADDVRVDVLRGLAQLQQGNEAAGVADLERAVAEHPTDANVRLELATAYLRTDRADKAVALLSATDRTRADLRSAGLLIAAHSAAGDLRQARLEVERLLAARPRDVMALNLAAGFFSQQREFDAARRTSQRALELDAKSVETLRTRARIEADAGDLAAAKQWLEKAAALQPANSAVRLALAELAIRRNDQNGAIQTLEDLRRQDAKSVQARLWLVGLYLGQRNAKAAQPVIDELNELGKDQPDVLNSLGLLYMDSGRYDEALLRFQAAALQDNSNPAFWLNAARAQLSLGHGTVARESLEKALAAQPGWMPAVGTLAMLDVKEGRHPEALARVATLKAARPRDVTALLLEGDVLMASRDFARAAADYEAAAAIKPSASIALRTYRARLQGGLPGPAQPLEKWLAAHPADNAVRLVLAEAYQRTGDKRRAVAQYEIMGRSGGESALMLNNLAWLYYELGDGRAEETARKAHELAPRAAEIADTYGWILVERGKAAEALELLRAAAADAPDPSIEYHYAVALVRSGAREEGRRKLTELLARAPGFEGAAEARKLLASLTP